MEEARPDLPAGFQDRRDPRRVAAHSREWPQALYRTVVIVDTPQRAKATNQKTAVEDVAAPVSDFCDRGGKGDQLVA
jgi:hypothetical protein